MKSSHGKVHRREEEFNQRITTKIWHEEASESNPYIAENCLCHGYDMMELMQKRSFVDVFYLMFLGELPSKDKAQLLEQLMVALINPGPRHPATRAAMCAGVGNTDPVNMLPISLAILSGSHLGAGEIESAMRFLRKNKKTEAAQLIKDLTTDNPRPINGDWHIAPGFGSRFESIDIIPSKIAKHLVSQPAAGPALKWGCAFSEALANYNMGWLATGVAAAVFCDLGFQPRCGGALYQLMSAPGLLAHGIELANKPITAMPFIKDEDYVIER